MSKQLTSDRYLAWAGFCGIPLALLLICCGLYQLLNLQSVQVIVTKFMGYEDDDFSG
jgi:hypothetical protein